MGASFAVVSALIVVAAGAGAWTIQQQAATQARIDGLQLVRDDVSTARYDVQDLVGWESLVVLDTIAFGYEAATGPDGFNRQQVIKGKERVYKFLDHAHTDLMTPEELAAFDELRPAWDAYFKSDDQVMAWLKADPKGGVVQAMDSINSGANAVAYESLMDATAALDALVKPRMAMMRAQAALTRQQSLFVLGLALTAALVLAVALSVRATRSVVRPLAVVVKALRGLARGDLTVRADLQGNDELSQLGRALDETTDSLRQTVGILAGHAEAMSTSSVQLSATAAQMADTAEHTSAQAELVSEGAIRVSANVKTVADGSDEIGASMREISQNASEAAQVASDAVTVAETTNATVARLGTSSLQISNFVNVITSIAEQTNLLALNATIEAARAGDAGKGFAVVASEVKDLAQETAKATEDIISRVGAIQTDTTDAVTAIDQITTIIDRISNYQNLIATAVEEQSATTAEMSRNVADAAEGSTDIAGNIAGVAEAATTTANGAGQTRAAAQELARIGAELRTTVAGFRL
jgi:methyl-accepting chemotaxis protein